MKVRVERPGPKQESWMSFIVEGPDGAGKSTLAEELGFACKLPVVHGGGPPKSAEEALRRMNEPMILDAVYDRNVSVSEQVYGTIRGSWIIQEYVIDGLISELIRANAVFIYCRPSEKLLRDNLIHNLRVRKAWKSPDHCAMVEANYRAVLEEYDRVFAKLRRMRAVVMDYDWTKERSIPCAE